MPVRFSAKRLAKREMGLVFQLPAGVGWTYEGMMYAGGPAILPLWPVIVRIDVLRERV